MEKFLITDKLNATYMRIFKVSGRDFSDAEGHVENGYIVGFNNLPEHISKELSELKNVKLLK